MKTILVVDDSQIMRNIVKNTFLTLKIPCEFREARNGSEALHIVNNDKIDLALVDWNMPMVSGLDFLKKVRSTPEIKDLPIVMITSEAAHYNVVEAVKHGVTGYLVKPFAPTAFAKTISAIQF